MTIEPNPNEKGSRYRVSSLMFILHKNKRSHNRKKGGYDELSNCLER